MMGQPGRGQLALLVEQITLGDEHQSMPGSQTLDRLANTIEELDRMGEHLFARGDELLDHRDGYPAARYFDSGLDHRQREGLHAVTKEFEVGHFDREESVVEPRAVLQLASHVGTDERTEP